MEFNATMLPGYENYDVNNVNVSEVEEPSVQSLAKFHMTYKIGEVLNVAYIPILVPIGVAGNFLSFCVMIQKHNRRMSFSLYICALAISDTVALLIGLQSYLRQVQGIKMPPNPYWNCALANTALWGSLLCSTLLILAMTFERFYSIIMPHKAASFNTVKRAKITIVCIVVFSFLYNLPHMFLSIPHQTRCLPYGKRVRFVQVYYWFSFCLSFAFPFVSLLSMNSVIIHTLRKRSMTNLTKSEGQGQSQGHSSKGKNSENQVYIMLLVVTFGFLVFITPAYMLLIYIILVDYTSTPQVYAGYYLFYHIAQKALFTNNGINFFLYVLSGQKFRADFVNLFNCVTSSPIESAVHSRTTSSALSSG